MWYVGLDLGKRWHYMVVMDEQGRIVRQQKLPNDPLLMQRCFETLEGPCRVVLEATGHWMAVYDRIEPHAQEVVLAHPLKVKAIASARIKTDKIDATTLAHLLRADLIPRAYIPPPHVREWRELVRHRAFLVRLQTRVKNRLQALLAKRGVTPPPVSDLFGKTGLTWLASLVLAEPYGAMRTRYLAVLERLRQQIREVEQTIDQTVQTTPEVQLLMTIPGIGRYLALLILGEIGEITRFPDPPIWSRIPGCVQAPTPAAPRSATAGSPSRARPGCAGPWSRRPRMSRSIRMADSIGCSSAWLTGGMSRRPGSRSPGSCARRSSTSCGRLNRIGNRAAPQ